MNGIDIIAIAALAWAAFNGWRRGMILQICTLAGIILGFWVAGRYCAQVGHALRIPDEFAAAGGFALLLVGVMILVALLSRLLRRVFSFAGLGTLDIALGVLFSCIKMLIILCAVFWIFNILNGSEHRFISGQTLAASKLYRPILGIADWFIPLFNGVTNTVRDIL